MRAPLLLLAAAAASLVLAAPARAVVIQPGAGITSGGSGCTLAWIFDGAPGTPQEGGVYGATAAHCVAAVGAEVAIQPSEPGGGGAERIGAVAFRGDPNADGRDYAFVWIDPEDRAKVDPRMKGHPGIPTGMPRAPKHGDTIQFSGYGTGFQFSATTREGRFGILNRLGAAEHDVTGAVSPGDSGGPVADVTDGGTALGIVNTVGAGVNSAAMTVVVAGEGGANLPFVLADAAARGFHVRLRTASGAAAGEE